MKKITICGLCIALLATITGCGTKFPDMTYEQEEKIVEYAANVVIKHMKNYSCRLVDLSLYAEVEDESDNKEQEGMDPIADTDVVDNTSGTVGAATLAEALMMSDFDISYDRYEVTDSYPNDGEEELFFTLDASTGKTLLVIHFNVMNLTEEVKEVSIFQSTNRFSVDINQGIKKKALSTMLLDDLSMFQGSFEPGEQKDLVIVMEIDKELSENIESLQMIVTSEMGNTTIQLQ